MKINEVKINEGRRVTDQNKIKELADSIKELGLLNPITVNEDGTLIAGMHRLEACKLLGYDEIKVNKINLNALLAELAEIDENLVRNELHWLEQDKQLRRRKAIYEQLHPGTSHGVAGGKASAISRGTNDIMSSDQKTFTEDTADKLGQSQRNIQRSVARAESIEDEEVIEQIKELDISKTEGTILARFEPEQQKKIIEVKKQKTDSSIKEIVQEIKKEEKKVAIEERREAIKEGLILHELTATEKKYRIIYADPPWKYGNAMPEYVTEPQDYYLLMSTDDICKMPVKEITEQNAVLFMWSTSPHLPEALQVVKDWGFTYKTTFIWDKIKHNMGHYNSVRHEILLVCTKGACTPDVKKLFDSVQSIERTEHSKKPEEFREIIETIYTHGNKIELFAREAAFGWDVFGNQIK